MSSELDNVKNQVLLSAKSIDEAAQTAQTAYANADDKKERLNAMGLHASFQGLEQVCEKLQNALATLGTAHGEATKATAELQGVASTMPIQDSLPKLGSAVAELGTVTTNLAAAAEQVGNARTSAENVGVEGIVAVCQAALDMIDTAKATVHTAANAVIEYRKRLEQETTELTGLNTGAIAPQSDTTGTAPTQPQERPASAQRPVIEQFIEQQTPINASYAGRQFPLPDDLAATYPQGVKFDDHGFPDFSPYAKHVVKIKMRGNREYGPDGDFGDANEKAGYPRNTRKHKFDGERYTWHHLHDRTTMLLVPTKLHRAVRHTGGVAVINKFGVLDDNDT